MKKLSNKILVVGLVILLAIFAASRFFRSPGLESNLRKELVKVDTATVNEIRILPSKDHTEEIRLVRNGKDWKVNKGKRQEAANRSSIKGILGLMANMQPQRLASRKKEKWEDFNVGKNSTDVSVYAKGKQVADFHVGKLGFNRGSGGGFGGAYTYVRLSDENEVYVVEGFLESSFDNSFNDWRDKTFLKLNADDITRISFRYNADSGFVVVKRDSIWFVDNEKADPSKVVNFIRPLSSRYLTEFADGFTPPGQSDALIQVDGKPGNSVTVEAWKKNGEWILTSSFQKGIYFSSKGMNVSSDLLIGKKKLLPGKK